MTADGLPSQSSTRPVGRPSAEHVLRVIRDAVVLVLEVDPDTVTESTRFVADLHADSLALIEVVEIVEEALAPLTTAAFHIADDALESLVSVGDAVRYALQRL